MASPSQHAPPAARPRRPWVPVLLAIHGGLLAAGAAWQAPTLDEPAHLVAGVSYWTLGRFELYRVNPTLVRMVAALPVLASGCETDWVPFEVSPGARPEFALGRKFVAANGTRTATLMTRARWACCLFSLVGAATCFLWARDLYGEKAGLLALVLWCFDPNLIAHGQLITGDAAASALGLLAGYRYWKWLGRPSRGRALAAGVALGLAGLTKTHWLLLYAVWPMLWVAWRLARRGARAGRRPGLAQLIALLVLSVYVVNLGYGFDGTMKRLGDFSFVSRALRGEAAPGEAGNRFRGSSAAGLPVPLPEQYVLGVDVQKRELEHTDGESYLRGAWRPNGWWYYYLYGLLVKVPCGTWLLAVIVVLGRRTGRLPRARLRDEAVLLVPGLALLALATSQPGFSHHVRYVLPAIGPCLVFLGQAATFRPPGRLARLGVGTAVAWSVASSLMVYPHSLSYFNEAAGGPERGHAHLLHSNIDWGQDLLFLRRWLGRHPEARPFYLVYYGELDPSDLGVPYETPDAVWDTGRIPDLRVEDLPAGWYAVSVNYVHGICWRIPDGKGGWHPMPQDRLACFRRRTPADRAGYSINIYRVGRERP